VRTRIAETILLIFICAALFAMSCSNERIPDSLPDTHGPSWLDKESPDFHGKVALAAGIASCAKCHGEKSTDDNAAFCIECHQAEGVCSSCHGGLNDKSGAPPFGLHDEIDDTTLAVGAHAIHLAGSSLSGGVACSSCHRVPVAILDSLHLDFADTENGRPLDSIAELFFSAPNNDAAAVWDRESRTCSNLYCHGQFYGGNGDNKPIWTGADQAACGSCHDVGANPETLMGIHGYHVGIFHLGCYDCHDVVVDVEQNIIDRDLHINGNVDFHVRDTSWCGLCHEPGRIGCVGCHGGTDNQTGAPPADLRGNNAATEIGVGAHTTHVMGAYLTDSVRCSECHIVPEAFGDPGHFDLDSVAEITWGPLAGDGSFWNRATRTCVDTYCHGNFSGGNHSNEPIWTAPAQANCGSCHADQSNPSALGGRHSFHAQKGIECYQCHSTTVNSQQIVIGLDVHVDGVKTISFSSGQGFFDGNRCTNTGCHGGKNWY